MKETDLNRIIFSSFSSYGGFSHKISDASPTQKPFDGIAAYQGRFWNIESKLIKDNFTSFNFSKIEDHQVFNLSLISKNVAENISNIVIVGYYVPRKLFGCFLFSIESILLAKTLGLKSFKKPDILQFYNMDKFVIFRTVKENGKSKYLFDKDIDLFSKVITIEDIERIVKK